MGFAQSTFIDQLWRCEFSVRSFREGIGKTVSSSTTNYLYDGANSIQELAGSTPTANLLTGGLDEVLVRSDASGTANFLADGLGSTSALTDSTGNHITQYTYDLFGNTSTGGTTSANPSQYTGREDDGTGLYYYRARYYHPIFSRFISEDPSGLRAGINTYLYAANNPTNFTDPSGNSNSLIHYYETYVATLEATGNPFFAELAANAVMLEDYNGTQGTSVNDTRHHAMGGRKDKTGQPQTPCQAFESTREFVNSTSDPFAAVHAIQDSYASGHQYQLWTGHLTWAHTVGDAKYIPAAQDATMRYWDDLLTGRLQDASAYLYRAPASCH